MDSTQFWQLYLIVGVVVIVAVALLLALLLSIVGSIEHGVRQLSVAALGVAANTDNIKRALTVMDTLDEVIEETDRHAELLGVKAR